MKPVKLICAAAFMAVAFSCATAQTPEYKVVIPLSEDEDGLKAYIVDYDSGMKLDSTVIDNSEAVFKGSVNHPALVQLIIDGTRSGMFVLEPGVIEGNISSRSFKGTTLNDALIDFGKQSGNFVEAYRAAANDPNKTAADKSKIESDYQNFIKTTMQQNAGNPLGYYLFLQEAYEMNLDQLDKAIAETPAYAKSVRVKRLRENLVKKDETSVGKKFKDFTITQPDGTKKSLSDYVGNGQYTLVDFWASWCGPCIRETKVLKEIIKENEGKNLKVLGVAVWDEVPNTLKAIETHQLPWEQILDAKTIPTDIYGISGIPCIILFDPEGNIVLRDLQDEALKSGVRNALATTAEE